jgi:hypothetical protein
VKALGITVALAIAVVEAASSCHQGRGGVVPNYDASDASSACAGACTALANAGCALGTKPDCPTFLQGLVSSNYPLAEPNGHPFSCDDVSRVQSKDDARGLGFSCP